MNQPRSIFEATQRFIMKHFVSQRCGSRPQKRNTYENPSSSIIASCQPRYSISSPFSVSVEGPFPSLSNPYCLLLIPNMTWSPWTTRSTTLEATVTHCWGYADCHAGVVALGALQLGQSKDLVTWYVSGKVMKVTGFDMFTWNLAMTSDLLKVNPGRNSKQNSVIGVKGNCHVFWNFNLLPTFHSQLLEHLETSLLGCPAGNSQRVNPFQPIWNRAFYKPTGQRAKKFQCTWKNFLYTDIFFMWQNLCFAIHASGETSLSFPCGDSSWNAALMLIQSVSSMLE